MIPLQPAVSPMLSQDLQFQKEASGLSARLELPVLFLGMFGQSNFRHLQIEIKISRNLELEAHNVVRI